MSRWLGIMLLASIVAAGCGSDNKVTNDTPAAEAGPGAFQADFRTSDTFFTMMSEMTPGDSPHGRVQIWYSSNVSDLLSESTFLVPVRTVAIKPFDMDEDGTEDGLAVMIKREPGYDADNNDWRYEMRDVSGNLMEEPVPGRNAMCISCHAAAADKDYLLGTEMR